jgi:hypothetical protein
MKTNIQYIYDSFTLNSSQNEDISEKKVVDKTKQNKTKQNKTRILCFVYVKS